VKRAFALLLLFTLLTGCQWTDYTHEATIQVVQSSAEDDAPEAADVLPELKSPGELSAPAVVTEGREPSGEIDLPGVFTDMAKWGGPAPITKLAELPDQDVSFYSVNNTQGGYVLLQWGDSLAEFDWLFATRQSMPPRRIPPRLFCFDIDGDREDELAVIFYAGGGTGISIEELHVIERGPDGALTDYAFPKSLWNEQVPTLFDTAVVDGRTFAVLGHELVEIERGGLDLSAASAGSFAGFDWNGYSLSFEGAFGLNLEGSAVPCYVADTTADVFYKDGVFSLKNFHLYSYDQ